MNDSIRVGSKVKVVDDEDYEWEVIYIDDQPSVRLLDIVCEELIMMQLAVPEDCVEVL